MSETVTGAELARLLLRRGTTAAEVAAMDLESLTRLVAYRRQKKIPSGAISPNMTDEQIARAILEYAQSDPGDWPVAPRETTSRRGCRSGLLGALGGGVGAAVFVVLGLLVVWDAGCIGEWAYLDAFLGVMLGTPLAAILGAILALRVTGVKTGTGLLKRALLPLATGLTVSFIFAAGFWWWQLADDGQVDRFINHYMDYNMPKSADTLLERYQAGERQFYDWNLRGADLSGADLSEADLSEANLSGADLSGADLSDGSLYKADLSGANLTGADLSGASLYEADLSGADLSNAELDRADLSGANLTEADLTDAYLADAYLFGANVTDADLSGANLTGARLFGAELDRADLSGANLTGADLTEANLKGAVVTDAQLAATSSLKEATMPDGTVHK